MNPEAAQVAYAAMAQYQVKSTLSIIINIFRKEEKKMEQYVRAEMEVVEFECEDVITTSGCPTDAFDGEWVRIGC